MPPKKKEEVVEKPILGRFSSHLKIGICGMPNVGKSTLFNVLTKCTLPAENFPFCTIDPNNVRPRASAPRRSVLGLPVAQPAPCCRRALRPV